MNFSNKYPQAPKSDQSDVYHGVEVKDPFRPLEQKSEARAAWIKAENELTADFLAGVAARPAIEKIAQRLWPYPSMTLPVQRGGKWFSLAADGRSKQTKVVASPRLSKKIPWRAVIDPNSWSDEGTVGINNCIPSPDGKLILYSFSWRGQDKCEWRICEVASRANRPDVIESNYEPVWAKDSKGLYSFDWAWVTTVEGDKQESQWEPRVRYHTVGTAKTSDRWVACSKNGHWHTMQAAAGQYLLLRQSQSRGERAKGPLLAVSTKATDAEPFSLLQGRAACFMLVGEVGSTYYFLTDLDAPRYRVIALDLNDGADAVPREIIAEQEQVLNTCVMVKGRYVVEYLDGPVSKLAILDKDGRLEHDVPLPSLGMVTELRASQGNYALYHFDSVALPGVTIKVDVRTGRQKLIWEKKPPGFDATRYQTELHFATSKDGTQVPLVVVSKKGTVWDGTNPTYMYGYGGFGISVRPRFDKNIALWLEMGGVYVSVCTRGGGEYGEAWHQAGTKLQKQNVFDDFIAAGEWLIANGVTSCGKLAIGGASNGGLLVAACLLQRPDLFAAVVCQVGVHDVVRYHLISKSKSWAPDYGTSDDEQEFLAILAYSPVQNVRPRMVLPAVWIATGANDDRVDPSHSFKLLAALQEAQAGDNPILGAIEMNSGHGIGTDPVDMQIKNCVNRWAFVATVLGMKVNSTEAALQAA
jgi:prolyl oligopeptidase